MKQVSFAVTLDKPHQVLREMEYQGLLIIEAFAEWCGPCKAIEQLFQSFNTEYLGRIRFVRVNSALVPFFRRFHGRSRPVFILVFCGKIKEIIVGSNYPRFSVSVPNLLNQDKFQSPEQFSPVEYFRELSSDPQFSKCWKTAMQEKEEAEQKAHAAREKGLESDADPNGAYDNVVGQFKDKWKHIKMFNDVRLQEQIGDLRVDMSGEDNKSVFTGFYSNYGLQSQEQLIEVLKVQLKFIQQVQQRKFDQMYTIAVFDNTAPLLENLQHFYGDVVQQYPEMYFCFLIKNLTAATMQSLKQQFIYFDNINILEDNNVVNKIFHKKIINKDEEEQFDQEFPTASYIFNHQDKLIEQHASALAARQFCFAKYGISRKQVYEQGQIDCRSPQFVGFHGQKLNILNIAQFQGKTPKEILKDSYNVNQAISLFTLNPISVNLQQQINDIQNLMKNKDTYFIVTFDDLQTLEDLQLLAQRVNITGINVIQDIPSAYKAAWSPIKTRNYLVEPVRDTLEQISGDLSITEKLKILTSLEKRDQVPANYIIPVIFFTPQRQEAQEIFTIAHLQNYLEQQKKLVEKLKLESKDELVEDKETAAVPILAVNSDDLVIYQRTLLSLNKANMTRNKYTCFCYLDNLSSDYWRQLFNVYQVQQQMTEIFFVVVLRSVISQANIEELAQKFYFTKQLNIFTYRSGLHKALQAKHSFEGQLFLLFNEQNELAIASQYIFETRNKVLRDLNEKKLRTLIPEVTFEKDCVIVRGQVIKFCQQLKPYDKQKRVVVAVFDQSEKDFQKTLHHYTVLTKKHRTCYFITIFKNEVEATSLKKKYEDCLQLNICIDQGQAVQFLNENDMQRTKVFNIFQDLQFDCSCNDLNKMQDLILDYSGTEWELGLPFKNKQLQFLNKSQLRAPGQPYVLSFFEYKDETTLLKMITEYYQKVQSAFSGIYFITCIQNITVNSVQQLESFRNNIYYFQEMNLVEDQDNICDRVLSQPIYNPGSEFAEDEEYDQVKSACFIFNETNQMVEAHANALDCRVFCSNVYNFRGWPTSHQNGIIEIDELEHQMAFKGQKIRFLQKVNYYKPGQNILVTKVDHKAKDFEQFIAENTSIKKCPQVYQIIIAKDIKQFKDYEDIANKFKGLDINLIEDKIAMPAPRLEMKKEVDKKAADKKEELVVQEDGRCFQSSILFGSNLQSFKPIIELDDLDRQVQRLQKIEIQESDRELEDEIQCTDKLTGVLQDDLTFRGQKFKYINKATNFPTPPRDDYFIENLEKSHFVLAIFNSNAFSYEDQMFQFYKATQIISKLYGACLLKGVAQATDLELLKKKFHFASRLNLLNYKQGLLKKYYKLDGKFDQIFLVFNGSGALKFKCNFVCELEEYARSRQDLECFAFDQKKIVPDVDKNGQYLSLKGVNYKYMSQVTQHDQQQGLVLAVVNSEEKRPGDDTKVRITELLKSYKELIKKQNTTIFITLLTSSDAASIYPDLKDMNCVENYQGIAQKLLRGSEKCFYVFRNNILDTVCPELKQMQEVVDKFIETRSEAIKEVVTSIKQTDIKNDDSAELGIDKKKVKKRVKVDGK